MRESRVRNCRDWRMPGPSPSNCTSRCGRGRMPKMDSGRSKEVSMAVKESENRARTATASNGDIERIYHEWDAALSKNDTTAILRLYAPGAVLESPLVSHLLGTENGVCRGHDELKRLFEILAT